MHRNKIQFGRPKKSKPKITDQLLSIESLSIEGRGVARSQGKTLFVDGALPGEQVTAKITQDHKSYAQAQLVEITTPSEQRIDAACEHYNHCGGCQLQHLSAQGQLEHKQQAVLSLLQHNAKTTPKTVELALQSPAYHYRRSARIGVNQLSQSGVAIVGFRRANSAKLLQVSNCKILPENMLNLFDELRNSLDQIDNAKSITHVEFLQGDNSGALTFRCKAQLKNAAKKQLLSLLDNLSRDSLAIQGYLRYDNETVALAQYSEPLSYQINDLQLTFKSGDFLQVNAQVNQQMINRALDWLSVNEQDKILDCFSGLGNFSLPLATKAGQVVGVEGSERMVERAAFNAALNGLDNCQFYSSNLSDNIQDQDWTDHTFNKLVLDPPRSGASELIEHIFQSPMAKQLTHILYVACDPSSLARDTKLLNENGFEMSKFCVMDMFPNTTHIESMALFTLCEASNSPSSKNNNTKSKKGKAKSFYEY